MATVLLALAGLAYASFTDLKERIVPDWLSYSMVAIGLMYHLGLSVLEWSLHPFLLSAGGAVLAFVFAYALWRIGAWAGGDVKLFTGLGALVPLVFPFITFLNSVILSFPFLMLYVFAKTATAPGLRKVFKTMIFRGVKRGVALGAVGALIAFVTNPALTPTGVSTVFASALFMTLFWEVMSYGREKALRSRIPVSKLEEGMISAELLYLDKGKLKKFTPTIVQKLILFEPKKTIASFYQAAGLEKKDIAALKRHGVKSLLVRESMPMVPVLFLGALSAELFGNLALLLLEML
ncbi:prepilin peptidase [archaeon]